MKTMKRIHHVLKGFNPLRYFFPHIFLLILGTSVLCVSYLSAQEVKKDLLPVAEFGEKMHDFGTCLDGQEVVHDFTIKNKGNATLEIQEVKTA